MRKMNRRDFLRALSVGVGAPLLLDRVGLDGIRSTLAARRSPRRQGGAVELVMWDWFGSNQSVVLDEEIRLFQEANPGITVTRVPFDPDRKIGPDTLEVARREGSLPDMFMSVDIRINQFPDYAYPLSSFSNWDAFRDQFPQPELRFVEGSSVFQGEAYTAPRDLRTDWWNQIYANTAVLNEFGVTELPTTLEQFIEACRQVYTNSGGSVYGYALPFSQWQAMMWQFTGASDALVWGLDLRTGRHAYADNPNHVALYEALATLREEGLVLPESSSLDEAGIRTLFGDGLTAFTSTGLWAVTGLQDSHPGFTDYTILTPLTVDGEPDFTIPTAPGRDGTAFFLGAQTEHPEEAWLWYQWWLSPEAGERWVAANNGFSIYPQANRPELLTVEAQRVFVEYATVVARVAPQPYLKNPAVAEVTVPGVAPDETSITSGIFSGQITRDQIAGVLAELAAAKDAAMDQAFADAEANGIQVSREDYQFPDWNPLEDYVQIAASAEA